jgi:hypothetical protein
VKWYGEDLEEAAIPVVGPGGGIEEQKEVGAVPLQGEEWKVQSALLLAPDLIELLVPIRKLEGEGDTMETVKE